MEQKKWLIRCVRNMMDNQFHIDESHEIEYIGTEENVRKRITAMHMATGMQYAAREIT